MTKTTIIILCVVAYFVGLIITSLICYIIDLDDDETIGISIFWPLIVPMIIVFAFCSIPKGLWYLWDTIYGIILDRSSKEDYEEEDEDD